MTLTRSTDFPGLHHQFSEGDAMGRMRRSKAVMIIKMAIVIALILVLGNHLLLMMDRHHHHKILCFIMADPRSVRPALAVRDTWGGRCDRLLFFSTERIEELKDSEVVILPPPASEGYYHLWGKVRAALTYLADGHHREEFDWFLKADDDTFILVDNLRRFLNGRNPDDPFWYGSRLKSPKVAGGSYNSGGAGYLLGRRALTAFIQQEQPSSANCSRMHIGYEDLELGRCLESVGIMAGDTRDDDDQHLLLPTFLPLSVDELLFPSNNITPDGTEWYWKALWWPHHPGRNCCSPRVISFHHVRPRMMYVMDYLIYGINR